jgi:hypothetical protein
MLFMFRSLSLRAANIRRLVLRERHNFITSNLSGTIIDFGKLCANCHNGKQTLIFMFFWQKYMYDGPKYMLGIRIPVRLDSDLFKQIRILERTIAVRAMNFVSRSPCCGKIRRI